jgi:hypothetical protein
MTASRLARVLPLLVVGLLVGLLAVSRSDAGPPVGGSDQKGDELCQPRGRGGRGGGGGKQVEPPKKDKSDDEDKVEKAPKPKNNENRIRWGQRRNETDEKYDKRYKAILKKVKQDKKGDFTGGQFVDAAGRENRLWTYVGHPFIVRTDIDAAFTADAAMYMEMLHRDYSEAYSMLLGKPADVKEKIEVIIFADQGTYMQNGGVPGSGGFFTPLALASNDRLPSWPARHFRLVQFTDGVTDFARWPKGTLKHESAHMELQLRLGFTVAQGGIGMPVRAPLWFNEGQATCFEYWDFDKTVEENFAEIPKRGRYAPVIRRIHETPKWQDFDYVWEIDPGTWHADMTNEQGFLNYAQAWSLVAYMMNEGKKGRQDFRAVYDLVKTVGIDWQTTLQGDRKKAWEEKFPEKQREKIDKNWNNWVTENLPRTARVPDEEWHLRCQGYRPEIVDQLERWPREDWEKMRDQIEREQEARQKEIKIEK